MPFKIINRFFASLKLTIVLLAIGMVLIFIGTLAQVDLGIYYAQKKYFETFVVWHQFKNLSDPVPVFPGGFTITFLLLINLIFAGRVYFRLVWQKTGITLIHSGIVLLILGGLATAYFAEESQLSFVEGESKNYSEDNRQMELVILYEETDTVDRVVSIPETLIENGKTFEESGLPFEIHIKKFWPNAALQMVNPVSAPDLGVTQGIGKSISVTPQPPETREDRVNLVTMVMELQSNGRSLGAWLVSNAFGVLQKVQMDGKTYWFTVRKKRYYTPYALTLKDFTHDRYPGTEIPKNFSSLILLDNPTQKEFRDVLIYMNHPLRYSGKTYYQASFGQNDTLSVLQVVKNPAWQVPYLACALIALGMLFHFGYRYLCFLKRKMK